MSELTATGAIQIISESFVAYGESNPSDGRGPLVELGRFSTVKEAIERARGKGVQGDAGSVSIFRTLLFEGGAVVAGESRLIARRREPNGSYRVGFLDLREFEYGVRLRGDVEVRLFDASIFARGKFAVPEDDSSSALASSPRVVPASELWSLLVDSGNLLVGAWRRRGDVGWRGELPAQPTARLIDWLPDRGLLAAAST